MKKVSFVKSTEMGIEAKKLDIIARLMKVRKEDVLKKYEQLLIEAQLFTRTEESMQAIENGQTVTLENFSKGNKEWMESKNIT
tara:strand:+ start:28563 stop:28811 length:249 start_codon:yes stop_codon:yes gene_type:complete